MSKELNLYSKKLSENIMMGGNNSLNNITELSNIDGGCILRKYRKKCIEQKNECEKYKKEIIELKKENKNLKEKLSKCEK